MLQRAALCPHGLVHRPRGAISSTTALGIERCGNREKAAVNPLGRAVRLMMGQIGRNRVMHTRHPYPSDKACHQTDGFPVAHNLTKGCQVHIAFAEYNASCVGNT